MPFYAASSPPLSLTRKATPNSPASVTYRERIALPSDAVIDVQLIDTSVADVAAQTVAEVLINAEGRQVPVPFTLTYDPAKIVPANRYSVRATIRSGDGMLMFSTTQAYPVLTHGAPSKVNLLLHTVGHGAHQSCGEDEGTGAFACGDCAGSRSGEYLVNQDHRDRHPEKEPAPNAAPLRASRRPAQLPPSRPQSSRPLSRKPSRLVRP